MPANPYDTYLEATILSADPIELVRILYRTATDSVREARGHLAASDIAARTRAVNKAWGALRELTFCLNREADPALARRLAELYDFMQRRLLAANIEQKDGHLAEVAGLLENLSEAWEKIEVPANDNWAPNYPADEVELAAAEL
jgi:flagellar secretion chaperone FliS